MAALWILASVIAHCLAQASLSVNPSTTWSPTDLVTITASGLQPNVLYTLTTTAQYADDYVNGTFQSVAFYYSDTSGNIDVTYAEPQGNSSYSDVDGMGPFWSMSLVPGTSNPVSPPWVEFANLTAPVQINAPSVMYSLVLSLSGSNVAKTTLTRNQASNGIMLSMVNETEPQTGQRVIAVFLTPVQQDGNCVPIIRLTGADGGFMSWRGMFDVAANGNCVLLLGYSGVPGRPPVLQEIPLEWFEAGANWLLAQSDVSSEKVVVWGSSRGAELTMILGSTFPTLFGALVADAVGMYHLPAMGAGSNASLSAWTYNGQPLPFLPLEFDRPCIMRVVSQPSNVGTFEDMQHHSSTAALWCAVRHASEATLTAAAIAVENTEANIIMRGANADLMWFSDYSAQMIAKRLDAHNWEQNSGFKYSVEEYWGMGHTARYLPYHPTGGASMLCYGGWCQGGRSDAAIARDSIDWFQKVRVFLAAQNL